MVNQLNASLAYAREHRGRYLQSLFELLRIPSVSNQPEHAAEVSRAARWLADYLRRSGFSRVERFPTAGNTIVYGEWLGAGGNSPTLLIYGHYDVQPAGSQQRWQSPPFEPEVRDRNIYGRGASDDKGQLFAALAAADACLNANKRLPLNVKFVLEGEEEQASPNIGRFVEGNSQMLAADFAFIADYAMVNEQTPAIIYGFRGITYVEIHVQGAGTDLHSGVFGGAVENPLNVLVSLLSQLWMPETRQIAIPGFYDRVRQVDDRERRLIARSPLETIIREQAVGGRWLVGEEGFTTTERATVRPTLDIHGISGGYVGPGQQTVIPSSATAKLSMRLVQDQDPREIAKLLEQYLHSLAPSTIQLDLNLLETAPAVTIDYRGPAFEATSSAFERTFGAVPVFMRSGGTLPVVGALKESLDLPVVVTGFGLPDDNWHAPNEKLRLTNFYGGLEMVLHLLFLAGEMLPR